MILNNSWVDPCCEFFLLPDKWADTNKVYSACQGKAGKEILQNLARVSAGNLVQTVASAVAIPFQILVGVFSCLHQCARGNWKEGRKEFLWGFITAGLHGVGLVTSPLFAVASALAILVGSPYFIAKWKERITLPSWESIWQRVGHNR